MTPPLIHHCFCTRFCRTKGPATNYSSLSRQPLLVSNRGVDSGCYVDWRIVRAECKTRTNESEGARRTIGLSWFRKRHECGNTRLSRRPRKARSQKCRWHKCRLQADEVRAHGGELSFLLANVLKLKGNPKCWADSVGFLDSAQR